MRAKLTAMFQSLTQDTHTFKPGDVVEWKPGMRLKVANGPFVITEVFPDMVVNDGPNFDTGNIYFRERVDCKVGFIDAEGEFVEYHNDSRRFQPFK